MRTRGKGACPEVEGNAAENCSGDKQEDQEVWSEDENEKDKAGENNGKREKNKTNSETNREDNTAKQGI